MENEEIKRKLTEVIELLNLQKPVLTLRETALLTGFSTAHIYQLVHKRKIPFYRNGRLFFKRSEVLEWMTDGKKEISSSKDESSTSKGEGPTGAFRLADPWLKAKYFPEYQGEICLLPLHYNADFYYTLIFHDGVYTGRYIQLYDKDLASHSNEKTATITFRAKNKWKR